MTEPSAPIRLAARDWWGRRRLRYNLALVAAGTLAFIAYVAIGDARCLSVPEFEITFFTTAIQAFAFAIGIGIANLCYYLGPFGERYVADHQLDRYRLWAFCAGVAFSVALPFVAPVGLLLTC